MRSSQLPCSSNSSFYLCYVIWYDKMLCNLIWCDVMWYDVMWCNVMWSNVMWCDVMCYKNCFPHGWVGRLIMWLENDHNQKSNRKVEFEKQGLCSQSVEPCCLFLPNAAHDQHISDLLKDNVSMHVSTLSSTCLTSILVSSYTKSEKPR